ncbi:MAG: sulfotransferase domain-containing protein [Eubacteriales bacterium]
MNYDQNKVIIFAHPRSGSTSLYKILNTHPDLNLALEPFHDSYSEWHPDEKNYIDYISDIPSLDAALEELFYKYNGMKILSYQLPEEIYKHLLNRSDCKVIFLWRANYLKSVVSVLIAEQTHIWQKSDLNTISGSYEQLEPLKIEGIDGIESRIKGMREGIQYWDLIISKKPEKSYYKVTYEDLYCSDPEQGLARVKDLFDFLGLEVPKTDKFIRFLEPRNEQINTAETYLMVPNIREINSRFGNSENGYLF